MNAGALLEILAKLESRSTHLQRACLCSYTDRRTLLMMVPSSGTHCVLHLGKSTGQGWQQKVI